jgi:cell division protein FtsI/penicillin-binding protein 2
VRTTLDKDLQENALSWVDRAGSRDAALVVLNPLNGRVLALAGTTKDGPYSNAALAGSFPAASVFKIVTAAAAIERNGYSADNTVLYDGSKHTLYKNNVVKEPDQGVHSATLKEGFAESINSVFGKLGVYTLGSGELAAYATRFSFNRPIMFEMPVEISSYDPSGGDEPFHLAELASGFNKTTRVSPLHGALLAAAVASGGLIFEPTFVSEVFDQDNRILYRSSPRMLGKVISPKTAGELSTLMNAAIHEGTGRKQFSDAMVHPVLSRLDIGGKSGTINDEGGARVDWFVAFAGISGKSGADACPVALSAVIVHEGRTNTVSQELVRKALISYYKPRLMVLDGKTAQVSSRNKHTG